MFTIEKYFAKKMILGEDVSVKAYSIEASNLADPIKMYIGSYITSSKEIL